jgi:hypothetical protein
VFKHYPGAEDIKDLSATTGGVSLFFEFETNDDANVVEAHYRELAKEQGWQPAQIETTGFAHAHPYYYFGDYGRAYVYGYYLDFFAVERGHRLKTYARIMVSKSLPVYPGATGVVTKQSSGADFTQTTVEFTTTATPDAVLAFYTDSYPEYDWQLDVEQSSGTKLYWKIGESSFASVRTQTASSGVVRITVVYYSGCCG